MLLKLRTSLSFNAPPEPAKIEVYDPNSPSTLKDTIQCMFRPTQIAITKAATWTDKPTKEGNVPKADYGGGSAGSLTLNLFFDTTAKGDDVRTKYTDKLIGLTVQAKGSQKKEPPLCRFVWGKMKTFLAYVPSVTVTFTMFLGDGTPVRAEAQVTLKEFTDEGYFKAQNPTSRSEARKTWQVMEGQRLDWIAYQEYGDPRYWRHIAEVNGLGDPMDIHPGQILKLTPLPPEEEA